MTIGWAILFSRFVLAGTGGCDIETLSPADLTNVAKFGTAVATNNSLAIVGAPDSTGGGAAYVFHRVDAAWIEEQLLIASDTAANDKFGTSVAIDGSTVVIGAPMDDDLGTDSGSALVFQFDGVTWTQLPKLLAADGHAGDQFGTSVAIDGDFIVVGAKLDDFPNQSNQGSAYMFHFDGTTWTQVQKLIASDGSISDNFGAAVSILGDTVAIGAPLDGVGSVYVFHFDGVTWSQAQKIVVQSGTSMGTSVALSNNALVAGQPGATGGGAVRIYQFVDDSWAFRQELTASDHATGDQFGYAVAISDGVIVVGAPMDDDLDDNGGAAYVFRSNGEAWIQTQKITSPANSAANLGWSAAITTECALIGAPGVNLDGDSIREGVLHSAITFPDLNYNGVSDDVDISNGVSPDRNADGVPDECQGQLLAPGVTTLTAFDAAANDYFGSSVAVSEGTMVVGSPFDDDVAAVSGSAYVFKRIAGKITFDRKLTASDAQTDDELGGSVAVAGGWAIAGAPGKDDQGNSAGAAYIFDLDATPSTQQKLLADDGAAGHVFGRAVAIDKATALVGASKAAYVFKYDGSNWVQSQKLAPQGVIDSAIGTVIGVSGDWIALGREFDDDMGGNAGAVYTFHFDGSNWVEAQKLFAPDATAIDRFGGTLAIASDLLIVGSHGQANCNGLEPGAAYVFRLIDGKWIFEQKLRPYDGKPGDWFSAAGAVTALGHFHANGVAIHGNLALVGSLQYDSNSGGGQDCGAVYVFRFNGARWIQQTILFEPDAAASNRIGTAVALSDDAIIVGSERNHQYKGAAFVFDVDMTDCNNNGLPDLGMEIEDDYILDNNVPSYVYGGCNCDLLALNHFVVSEHTEVINYISVVWSVPLYIPAGVAATVLLYDDSNNDGDPSDALMLASASTQTANVGGVSWIRVPITPTFVGNAGESFFVGVMITLQQDQYGQISDSYNAPLSGSWSMGGAAGTLVDLTNLSNNPYPPAPFNHHWCIRAIAQDCNANGVWDECDIDSGTSIDANNNGFPDECEKARCPADIDDNGAVNTADLLAVINSWGPCLPPCPADIAPRGGDGQVNAADLLGVINTWGSCP